MRIQRGPVDRHTGVALLEGFHALWRDHQGQHDDAERILHLCVLEELIQEALAASSTSAEAAEDSEQETAE